ncbi:MAG TPA: 5'-methylthioadenosine/adenosylhomocysteine nucleosidase [Aquabacterium sp.]|nr:5'-methylthioadenosine/adenosylhomocysteine nucleosidase [Aquabacterium sp.]
MNNEANATPAPRRIGILAAMPEELQTFLDEMPDEHQVELAGRTFWVGHWHGHVVIAVLSGIGKVAAAVTTSLLINRFHAAEIWFTGVAGGLGSEVRVGDVVVADELVQHDMDARPLFPRYELPGKGVSILRAHSELSDLAVEATQAVLSTVSRHGQAEAGALSRKDLDDLGIGLPSVHRGLVASGDQFIGSVRASQAIRDAIPATLAVEMEGAAVAQVCHDFGVPFTIIRSISDRADDAAHVDFQRFIRAVASPVSHAVVDAMLRRR